MPFGLQGIKSPKLRQDVWFVVLFEHMVDRRQIINLARLEVRRCVPLPIMWPIDVVAGRCRLYPKLNFSSGHRFPCTSQIDLLQLVCRHLAWSCCRIAVYFLYISITHVERRATYQAGHENDCSTAQLWFACTYRRD